MVDNPKQDTMSNLNQTNSSPRIWVLVDHRLGNAHQAIELADAISSNVEIKNVKYNLLSKLPNCILNFYPLHIKNSILLNLRNQPLPEMIISAGRRTAVLALYLKRLTRSKSSVKIIQIMGPDIRSQEFDLVILPEHDTSYYQFAKTTRILGALTNIHKKIQASSNDFITHYPYAKNFIAVMIGGSSKGYTMTLETIKILIHTLSNISKTQQLPLFITFSRRTPQNIKDYCTKTIGKSNIIYDPHNNQYNPYPGMLGEAKYIVTTIDSISMCSEATGTGLPVYVFCPDNFKLKKHLMFNKSLIDRKIIKELSIDIKKLEQYKYHPLTEIKRVAQIVKQEIF